MLGYVVRAELKTPSLGWMGNSLKGLGWAGASGEPRHPIMEFQYSAAPGDLSTLPPACPWQQQPFPSGSLRRPSLVAGALKSALTDREPRAKRKVSSS